MANGGTGSATVDFGAAPGSSYATVDVTGQSGFVASSFAEAWMQGDSTATHNAVEHLLVPLTVRCGDAATDQFTIHASTEYRLTGTFTVRWVWSV